MKRLCVILGLIACCCARAEVIPPVPPQYFNDYARVISPATGARLNQALEDFEKQTSSQLVVAIYPKMETDSALEDYTVRILRAWKPGLKGKDNGAILFVFVQDHKMRIENGYGMEGVLPDAICKRILDDEITPRLKQGDYNGGLSAGVAAMMAAAKGEYKGTGQTVSQGRAQHQVQIGQVIFWVIVVVFILMRIFSSRRGFFGGGAGWLMTSGGIGGWSGGGGGGGWSGGGGGGGFSGGGGSGGGGGASGSW